MGWSGLQIITTIPSIPQINITVIIVVVVIVVVVLLLAFAGGFLIGRSRGSEGEEVKEVHSAESQRRVQGLLMGVRSRAASGTRRRSTQMAMFHLKASQTPCEGWSRRRYSQREEKCY